MEATATVATDKGGLTKYKEGNNFENHPHDCENELQMSFSMNEKIIYSSIFIGLNLQCCIYSIITTESNNFLQL